MRTILALAGMTIGGYVGWEIGALVSTVTAFVVSMVGTGAGLYAVNRFSRRYLP